MLLCVFLNTEGWQQPFELVQIIEVNTGQYMLLIQTLLIKFPPDTAGHDDRLIKTATACYFCISVYTMGLKVCGTHKFVYFLSRAVIHSLSEAS